MSNENTHKHEYVAEMTGAITTLSGLSYTVEKGEHFFVDSIIAPAEVLADTIGADQPKARLYAEAKVKPVKSVKKMEEESAVKELQVVRKQMAQMAIDQSNHVSQINRIEELSNQLAQLMDVVQNQQAELTILREVREVSPPPSQEL